MTRQFRYALFAPLLLICSASAFAQSAPADVHARLSLADKKATYRTGELIQVVLELTADREGYQADKIPDGTEPIHETVLVSPDSGVNRWIDDYLAGRRGFRDYFAHAKLSATPTRVPFFINDSIRFDRPGRYSIKVTTNRVLSPSASGELGSRVLLTTNEIIVEIVPMSDADEENEVKRLSDLFDVARGWQAEEKVARELAYLAGDPATREKVKRFLNADGRSGNYYGQIHRGLFIARNRALVLQMLESALRDTGFPVNYSLLSTTVSMRLLRENNGAPFKPNPAGSLSSVSNPRFDALRDAYVSELAAGLAKRSGKSQTTTAMTILMHLPKEPESSAALVREVRRILLQQFDNLHPFDQEYLLRQYWDKVRDDSLVPSLKKMLSSTGVASKNIHDVALKRLIEIAPEEARPFVIIEIRDPKSLVQFEILSSLEDKYLPEVDDSLREQLLRSAASKTNFDRVHLQHKGRLAARYATAAIYADLMEIYRNAGGALPTDTRSGFLAYFARHNEPEALSLIGQTLETLAPGEDFNVLPDLTRLYYSDRIEALLRKRLESDVPQTASTAAYLLSLHGAADSQKVIEDRLERWRKDWSARRAEADANSQGTVERELIMALINAKSWKASPERARELQQSCVTQICRRNFRLD